MRYASALRISQPSSIKTKRGHGSPPWPPLSGSLCRLGVVLEPGEDLARGVFEDVLAVLVGEPGNRVNVGLDVVQQAALLGVEPGAGAGVFRAEHAAVGADGLEQQLKRFLVV